MTSVYAVSSGEYSYYTVHAVFPTRASAEMHVAARNRRRDGYGKAFVEELTSFTVQPVWLKWWEIQLRMNDDGSYPPEPKAHQKTGWEYDAPKPLSDRPHTWLLYSKPWISDNSTYEGPAFGYTKPTEFKQQPGQYGLFGQCFDKRALERVASATLAQWTAQNFHLHNAEPWK